MDELLDLALHEAGDGDARPLGVDLLLQVGGLALVLLELLEALLELGDLAVAQLGGALEIGLALGALGLAVRLLEALLDLAGLRDRLLLALPGGLHRGG